MILPGRIYCVRGPSLVELAGDDNIARNMSKRVCMAST